VVDEQAAKKLAPAATITDISAFSQELHNPRNLQTVESVARLKSAESMPLRMHWIDRRLCDFFLWRIHEKLDWERRALFQV
jgi:hypothetical protein